MTRRRTLSIWIFLSSFIFVAGFSSCQKDKLEGDALILEGEWTWTSSILVTNYCEPDSTWNYELEDEVSDNKTYSLEFLKKGNLIFSHNGGRVWNQRIVFLSQEEVNDPPYEYEFVILLNNNEKDQMKLLVGQDALLVYDYPKDTDNECEEMLNYFTKVN